MTISNKMASRPSSYEIVDMQRNRGQLPSLVKASPQFRQIAQNIQQKQGIRNLENYELTCTQQCETSSRLNPNVNIQECMEFCLQYVMEQTRIG
jgi:hypothetical protein